MRNQCATMRFLPSLSLAVLIGMAAAALAVGQATQSGAEEKKAPPPETYSQNAAEFKVDTPEMPAGVQEGYRLFRAKCGECHSLNRLLTKTDLSADEWTDTVYRMQDMASSHTNAAQSKAILQFVIWDDQRRKKEGQQNDKH